VFFNSGNERYYVCGLSTWHTKYGRFVGGMNKTDWQWKCNLCLSVQLRNHDGLIRFTDVINSVVNDYINDDKNLACRVLLPNRWTKRFRTCGFRSQYKIVTLLVVWYIYERRVPELIRSLNSRFAADTSYYFLPVTSPAAEHHKSSVTD